MNTPICDFVSSYAAADPLRLHMPGHKGKIGMGAENLDITEIPGADVLYHPSGIILESENNASSLFGTKRTVYSAEGSSLPIRAMLYLVALYAARQGGRPLIAAGRNAHKVFITAAALLDLDVAWIYPENHGSLLQCEITPEYLGRFLAEQPQKPVAVYLTSPDYLGNMADVARISRVCREFGCLLLVDNAHGAYLNFLPTSMHPIALGADLCCDSAHKTLPVLTGGAYLHISAGTPELFAQAADQAMALFASTSPSYLILQSLDRVNALLASGWKQKLAQAVEVWDAVKQQLARGGYCLAGSEPLKLTILPKPYGYTGEELAALLEEKNIFCEFADPDHLVLMLPVEFEESMPARLAQALLGIPKRDAVCGNAPVLQKAKRVLRPHEALLRASREVSTVQAAGRIMAAPSVSCPPAIPVVCCGELIEPWAVETMLYYGITGVRVVEEE